MPPEPPKCRSCIYKAAFKFKKPTIEQLKEYAKSIGWSEFDAEYFYWKNESIGWVNNKGLPYKNWKGVVQTWFKAAKRRGDIQEQKETFKERHLRNQK